MTADINSNLYYCNQNTGIWEQIARNRKKLQDIIYDFDNFLKEKEYSYNLSTRNKRQDFIAEVISSLQVNNLEFDKNPYLLAFTNGVVELRTGIFRKAKPEEYILSTTGWDYEYLDEYADYPLAKELFTNLFNNEKIRCYFINTITMALENINRNQEIIFLIGTTAGNGKSTICKLLNYTFGKLGTRFPTSLITSSRENSNSANSALIDLKSKLFAYCSEPEKNKKININVVKELTGDEISGRQLFKGQEQFEVNATIFVCDNSLLPLDDVDEGITR